MSSTQLTTFNHFSDFPPQIRALIEEYTFDAVPVQVVDLDNHVHLYAQIKEEAYRHITSADPKTDRLFLTYFRVKCIDRYSDSHPRAGEKYRFDRNCQGDLIVPSEKSNTTLFGTYLPCLLLRLVKFILGPGRWASTRLFEEISRRYLWPLGDSLPDRPQTSLGDQRPLIGKTLGWKQKRVLMEEIDAMRKNGTLDLGRWASGDKTYGMKDPKWEEEGGRRIETEEVRRGRLGRRELKHSETEIERFEKVAWWF